MLCCLLLTISLSLLLIAELQNGGNGNGGNGNGGNGGNGNGGNGSGGDGNGGNGNGGNGNVSMFVSCQPCAPHLTILLRLPLIAELQNGGNGNGSNGNGGNGNGGNGNGGDGNGGDGNGNGANGNGANGNGGNVSMLWHDKEANGHRGCLGTPGLGMFCSCRMAVATATRMHQATVGQTTTQRMEAAAMVARAT